MRCKGEARYGIFQQRVPVFLSYLRTGGLCNIEAVAQVEQSVSHLYVAGFLCVGTTEICSGNGCLHCGKHFFNVCLYVSFFPQLIAGPIVRYQTVADEIEGRVETWPDFVSGVHRFMVGFCKKTILANNLGLLVDTLFGLDRANLSVGGAWIAAAAYLMQVYYDFSGYSDMAIGLGKMFGFHFLENFRFPFIAKSATVQHVHGLVVDRPVARRGVDVCALGHRLLRDAGH